LKGADEINDLYLDIYWQHRILLLKERRRDLSRCETTCIFSALLTVFAVDFLEGNI